MAAFFLAVRFPNGFELIANDQMPGVSLKGFYSSTHIEPLDLSQRWKRSKVLRRRIFLAPNC